MYDVVVEVEWVVVDVVDVCMYVGCVEDFCYLDYFGFVVVVGCKCCVVSG